MKQAEKSDWKFNINLHGHWLWQLCKAFGGQFGSLTHCSVSRSPAARRKFFLGNFFWWFFIKEFDENYLCSMWQKTGANLVNVFIWRDLGAFKSSVILALLPKLWCKTFAFLLKCTLRNFKVKWLIWGQILLNCLYILKYSIGIWNQINQVYFKNTLCHWNFPCSQCKTNLKNEFDFWRSKLLLKVHTWIMVLTSKSEAPVNTFLAVNALLLNNVAKILLHLIIALLRRSLSNILYMSNEQIFQRLLLLWTLYAVTSIWCGQGFEP